VKCLVHYHPDDEPALRVEQEARVAELWAATRISGHELLLELIPPKGVSAADPEDAVLRAVSRFYNLGFKPEWWKLAPLSSAGWQALGELVAARDPYCRGAVILGLNQPLADLARGFQQARDPIVKGFMVGRTLWAGPSLQWLQGTLDDADFIAAVSHNFSDLLKAWTQSRGTSAPARAAA
jgi:5-dehydro-2-deoxygluconokinase